MEMSAVAEVDYGVLLKEKQPRVIRTEEQNESYIKQLEELCEKPDMSPEERELADLLTLLIESFEEEHYSLTPTDPLQIIRELMDAHGLRQKDLVDVFGTTSLVSEVLRGKRPLSLLHVKRLSKKFAVSPQVFISAG
jgi:HTH-type transcriptional regulator/antitoxin HigA